jgi:transcriptional regulator with XRE-family HTH domain
VAIGQEFREARLNAGLTQVQVGHAVGISSSAISRIELGQSARVSYRTLALVGCAVGLDVPLRGFPSGEPIRDAAQVALLGRFRARTPGLRHVAEVLVGRSGSRAWDEVVSGGNWTIPVDAETRLRDLQAVHRKVKLKMRDAGVDRVILLVADTRHNRHVLRLAADVLAPDFPLPGSHALAALAQGRRPAASAIVVL